MENIRIPVTVGGVTFQNPFYVASGPTTKSVRQLLRIEETGWAAASIKLSIDPAPYLNRKPRYSLFKDRDALAFTAEKRLTFQEGLRLVEEAKPKLHSLLLMANMTYAGDAGPEGWVNMAKRFEEAGADIIELNMCCPNMSYNLEMTSGGSQTASKQTGASMGQQADVAAEIVSAIKGEISIPLFVKLTPEGGQIAKVAQRLYAAGADAVGSTGNRLGMPPIDLDDPGKAFYHLQQEISMGCYCSGWLKPLAQRDTYEISRVCGPDAPIMAAGGIRNWQDAVEMVLCGGTLLGVCAETLISGYDIVRPMIAGLDQYMRDHCYTDLTQMRGVVVPQVRTAADVTLHAGYARIKEPNLSAPCKSACPLHVPVQAYLQKVAKREYRAAWDLITAFPLQELCALVCTHPCEDACVRGSYDSPLKIREVKRFVLEYGNTQGWTPAWAVAKENGHSVAVIGAGPCGLACAVELRRAGYSVTIFEQEAEAGGMLRYGLPAYAGHRKTLQQIVTRLKCQGIRFVFGQRIDNADLLRAEGFERVFAAVGAGRPLEHETGGEDALALLTRLARGETPQVGRRIAITGSDRFTAWETARAVLRLGAEQVTLLLSGAPGRWEQEKLRLAREEGATVLEGVTQVCALKGSVTFLREGIPMELACDQLLTAQARTARPPVGGKDLMLSGGPQTAGVAAAIAAGKNAAADIDHMIRTDAAEAAPVSSVKTVDREAVRRRTGYLERNPNPLELVTDRGAARKENFQPYTRAMTEEEAVQEASRCLNCGCGEGCQLCKTICTDFAPKVVSPDKLEICQEDCVACGMCFNRCPNGNIEMVDLGDIL